MHVGARHAPRREARFDDAQLPRLRVDELPRERDLLRERRAQDRGRDHVARERQARGVERIRLIVDLGTQRFERAPVAAEYVECVRHAHRRVIQRERPGIRHVGGQPERGDVDLLARRGQVRVDARQHRRAGFGRMVLPRFVEPRAGLGERWAVAPCGVDEAVERFGAELRPPALQRMRGRRERLRVAGRPTGGGRGCGRCIARVLLRGRRLRRAEIRPDRTSGEQCNGGQRAAAGGVGSVKRATRSRFHRVAPNRACAGRSAARRSSRRG